jgi:hypothetical protein
MLLGKLMPTQFTGADGDPVRFQAVGDDATLAAMRTLIDQVRVIGTPLPEGESPTVEPVH